MTPAQGSIRRSSSSTAGSARISNASRAKLDEARDDVQAIERELKHAGVIPKTAQELLGAELDSVFPDAAGTDVVAHKGSHYKRTFFAVRKTRRGKVQQWGRTWGRGAPSPLKPQRAAQGIVTVAGFENLDGWLNDPGANPRLTA